MPGCAAQSESAKMDRELGLVPGALRQAGAKDLVEGVPYKAIKSFPMNEARGGGGAGSFSSSKPIFTTLSWTFV